MEDWKIGDRVEVIRKIAGKINVGDKGTVRIIRSGFSIGLGVEFDRDIDGHSLSDIAPCRMGHGWNVNTYDVKKITDFKIPVFNLNRDAVAKIVEALKGYKERYGAAFDKAIKAHEQASTIEEIMKAKQELLSDVSAKLPLGADVCYFCNIFKCNQCPYAKHHGKCPKEGSDFKKIITANDALFEAIRGYYKGETYTPAPPKEIEVGSIVTVHDGSWSLGIVDGKLRHTTGRELLNRKFRVTGMNLKLPTDDMGIGADEPNNTIIQDIENGDIVFIQKEFLRLAEEVK